MKARLLTVVIATALGYSAGTWIERARGLGETNETLKRLVTCQTEMRAADRVLDRAIPIVRAIYPHDPELWSTAGEKH